MWKYRAGTGMMGELWRAYRSQKKQPNCYAPLCCVPRRNGSRSWSCYAPVVPPYLSRSCIGGEKENSIRQPRTASLMRSVTAALLGGLSWNKTMRYLKSQAITITTQSALLVAASRMCPHASRPRLMSGSGKLSVSPASIRTRLNSSVSVRAALPNV